MEKLGREMIKRCRGLPLAILVLGGILATKPALSQWEIVHENIGTGEGIGKHHQAEVEEILISSYYDLPDELKPCFLYLCKFPEDSEIEAERLYQLWMAEGMVLSKDRREGETMMEVAESYMGELSHRCMIQVEFEEDESSVRKFKSCCLHDCMRDLSLKKAKEEDFFKVLDIHNRNNHEVGELSSSSNYTRRLVISPGYEANSDDVQIIYDKEVGQHLRSLLLTNFVQWEWKPPIPVVAGFHPSNLKYLRILALEGIQLEFKLKRNRIKNIFGINCCSSDHKKNNTIIEEEDGDEDDDNVKVYFRIPSREVKVLLSNLIHLRYLSFRWSSIKVFPSYTGNLEHLQTLDLRVHGKRRCHSPSFLSVSGMLHTMGRRLHHLYLPRHLIVPFDAFPRLVLPLNGLSNLETLENFNPAYCEVKDLIQLTNLRKLTMCVNDYMEGLEDILNYLLSSQVSSSLCFSSLVIRNGSYIANSEIGRNILRQIWGCCNLHQLEIHGAIQKLPPVVTDNHDNVNFLSSLTTLLLFCSSLEEDPMETLERIPNLRSLVLSYNAFLGKEMVCSAVGFPQLKSLQLCYLRNLEEWMVDDGAMPNVSTIQIECCNKLEMLPDGFRFLTALRVLNIVDMPEDFRYRIQSRSVVDGGVGEDFYKVRHVPCINLRP